MMTKYQIKPEAKLAIDANKLTSFKKAGKEYSFDTITDEQIESLWADKDGKFDAASCSIFQLKTADKTEKTSGK